MRTLFALALVSGMGAFGLDVRKSPAEYPLQGEASDFRFGVEYLVRSFLSPGQSLTLDDSLVVEIGVFPAREADVDWRRFTLRLNGQRVLLTQTAGAVAAGLKYPDWTYKPRLEGGVGLPGSGGVMIGRPQRVGRFPGDPTPGTAPRPSVSEGQGNEKPPVDYEYILKRDALPEGKLNRPVAGFLFFPYDGKLKALKSVELLVDGVPLKLK